MRNFEPISSGTPPAYVCKAWRWLGYVVCLLAAVGLRTADAASDAASDFAKDYGEPTAAISSREAGALLLELVNVERAKNEVGPLTLSASASKLAKEHAEEMAAHNYVGHYDLMGQKCERRYNLLGETDYVAENVAFREVGARVRLTPELVTSIFNDWLQSKSHRNNILELWHTRMGYGFAVQHSGSSTKIYAVQEFVNAYGYFPPLPLTGRSGDRVEVFGSLVPGIDCSHISIAMEPSPPARLPKDIGEADLHYRQPAIQKIFIPGGVPPPPYLVDDSTKQPAIQLMGVKLTRNRRDFSIWLTLPKVVEQSTDLYIDLWVVAEGFTRPGRAMTQVIRIEPELNR